MWIFSLNPMFFTVLSALAFLAIGFFLVLFMLGSARREDTITFAGERLRKTIILALPLLGLIAIAIFILEDLGGYTFPFSMTPQDTLTLFFIFTTLTVFVFTWGLKSSRGKTEKDIVLSERYKARFFVNIAIHNLILLSTSFFGFVSSQNFFFKALALFSIIWSFLILIYLMEFVIHFAHLEKYVYEDLLKKH
ncbi:MAG: hypothetical protein GOU98_04545 [Candidatus Altiarchaeota archaeon]|nr:hypothetical protein [Candidatus Altiarchaeota archaeon]